MVPVCPVCASPFGPDAPEGMPMLGLDSNGLDLEPGKDIGFTPLYCPLGHAALLQLAWREVPVLGSSADYLSALVQAARDFGLDVPAEDDLKKKLGL